MTNPPMDRCNSQTSWPEKHSRKYFSRKDAKAQSASAFLRVFFAPLREKYVFAQRQSDRIKLFVCNQRLADVPRSPVFFNHRLVCAGGKLTQNPLEFLVEHLADLSVSLNAVTNSLCNHQTIDAVRRKIFHITIKQAGALAVEHAIAITDDRADRRARSVGSNLADSFRSGPQIRMRRCCGFACVKLIRKRELLHRDLVLIGMSGPGPIHKAVGLVLLVFGEHAKRPRVQFWISAAGVKSRHAANRQYSVFVTSLSQQLAQILKERHVVRNRV